jgi:hypothetical protein
MKEETLLKLINIIRNLREDGEMVITNNASSGKIAGLPPDNPPVFKNRKTEPKRKNHNPFFKNLSQIERRNPPQ